MTLISLRLRTALPVLAACTALTCPVVLAGPPLGTCVPGLVVTAETSGHCCWPGQGWNGTSCVGAPLCPDGLVAIAYRCANPSAAPAAPSEAIDRASTPASCPSSALRPLTRDELTVPFDPLREQAHRARLESIGMLQGILQNFQSSSDQKPELLLRMAGMYYEEGLFYGPQDPHAADWLAKGAKLYSAVLTNHPDFARADEAAFFLANALDRLGRQEEALEQRVRLVKTYPDSRYGPAAYLTIGEHYYTTGDAFKALLAYRKASAFKSEERYGFALYKLAWCYAVIGETARAVTSMASAVAVLEAGKDPVLAARAQSDLVAFSGCPSDG